MPISKETAIYRKRNNLCPRCGDPNEIGKSLCPKHLKQFADKAKKYRTKRLADSRCPQCNAINKNGKYYCDECSKINAFKSHKYHTNRRIARTNNHLCTVCGTHLLSDDIENNYRTCPKCRTDNALKQMDIRNNRVKNNLCVICGKNVVADKKYCNECSLKRSEWYEQSSARQRGFVTRREKKEVVFDHYGNKCINCGISDIDCSTMMAMHTENK